MRATAKPSPAKRLAIAAPSPGPTPRTAATFIRCSSPSLFLADVAGHYFGYGGHVVPSLELLRARTQSQVSAAPVPRPVRGSAYRISKPASRSIATLALLS